MAPIVTVPITVATSWIKMAQFEGFQRIKRVNVLGDFEQSVSHYLTVYYNYDDSNSDTYTLTPSADKVNWRVHLSRQKCTAIKLEYSMSSSGPFTVRPAINGFSIEVGVKKGMNKLSTDETGH